MTQALRPLSPRQRSCLSVIADGSLYIKDGSVMRTVKSLEARGLIALTTDYGRMAWRLTEQGRAALEEVERG